MQFYPLLNCIIIISVEYIFQVKLLFYNKTGMFLPFVSLNMFSFIFLRKNTEPNPFKLQVQDERIQQGQGSTSLVAMHQLGKNKW